MCSARVPSPSSSAFRFSVLPEDLPPAHDSRTRWFRSDKSNAQCSSPIIDRLPSEAESTCSHCRIMVCAHHWANLPITGGPCGDGAGGEFHIIVSNRAAFRRFLPLCNGANRADSPDAVSCSRECPTAGCWFSSDRNLQLRLQQEEYGEVQRNRKCGFINWLNFKENTTLDTG